MAVFQMNLVGAHCLGQKSFNYAWLTMAAVAATANGIPMHHQPRVLAHTKATTTRRKNEIKAMIASVQNAPQKIPVVEPRSPSPTPSKASPSAKMLAEHVKDETLLKVKIKSSIEKGKFYVPVSLLVDRELEMRKAAKDFGIRSARWSNSRLFREWRNQLEQDVANNETTPRTEIVIELDPEEDCISTNQSHSFQWQPWLTTCIRAYFNTGTIRIPDDCIGSDILLALEYFGILYSPDQLVFDSFGGYLRVKMWSDYFTHRAKMADWVVQKLVTTPSRHSHCFVTSPTDEGDLYFLNSNKTMQVLDGELLLDKERYGATPSRAVIHEFFNDEQQDKDDASKMDGLMRQDFCAFVQASLPGTNVTFTVKQVMTSSKETVERAVLCINLVPKPTPEGAAVSNPLTNVDKDFSVQETATTQPLTVSTQGADKTTIARAIVMRRSKQYLDESFESFEDRPDDEYTPNTSPQKEALNTSWADVDSSPQKQALNRSWADEPSVDQPRETLNEATDFVRSLSEKIIRQTIADMDTIDKGSKQTPGTRPPSLTPFDERAEAESEPHLTEDDIQKCRLPSLPSLEFDKDYDRRPTALPFQARPCKEKCSTTIPKLEVIGQITTPNTTPKAASPIVTPRERPAPVAHVDVVDPKPCDGSVMSALSSPFEETHVHPLDVVDVRRPQPSVELSGFRTPVDALSLTDDKSVRIEGQEEDEAGSVDDDDDEEEEEEEEELEEEEEEEQEPPKRKKMKKTKKKKKTLRAAYVDPDEDSQTGCVSNFLNAVCSPLLGGESGQKTRSRRRRDPSDDDTPNTVSETDEEDDDSGDGRRPSSCRRRNERMSGQEMIAEIGGMADTLVDGITESFASIFGLESCKQKSKSRKSSRRSYSCRGDDDDDDEDWTDPSNDELTADVVADEGTVEDTLGDIMDDEGEIVRIIPEARYREKPVRKHDRPPLPAKFRASRSGRRSPNSLASSENSLERIQQILRSKENNHFASKRRSENVKRNLELLQTADAPTGYMGRISVVQSTKTKTANKNQDNKKRDNTKKGLLGFLRKK